jgi:hypothetical protein
MGRDNNPEWFSWHTVSLSESHRLQTIAILLGTDRRLMKFLFDFKNPRLRLPTEELLKSSQCFSRGEQLLIAAAIDIWSEAGVFSFASALNHFDDTNMSRLVRAICHLREIREEVMHGLIDDQNGGFCL